MRDYSRKNYTDYQYKDWMRSTPSKAIWNSILSQNTGYGEFSLSKSSKSSLSRAVASYLKQSERKKPYSDRGFVAMEDDWEGPEGGFTPRSPYYPPGFDQPWNVGYPGDTPWTVIFDITSTSCWCVGEERGFEISGTHPIYSLAISLHESGTYIIIDGGLGTNTVFGRITAGTDEVGDVNITGFMTTYNGISGSDNYLMPECRDCDPCIDVDPLVAGSNPETIAQSGSETLLIVDGKGDFNWSVSGSGFTLDDAVTSVRSNTLNADASACGIATITVTDVCDDSIEIQVRSLGDSQWVEISTDCEMAGASTEGDGETRIVGGYKQWQDWHGAGGSGCFASSYGEPCANPCWPYSYGDFYPECITFNCPELKGDPSSYAGPKPGCCNTPCPYPVGGQTCSYFSNSGGVKYYEWQCI